LPYFRFVYSAEITTSSFRFADYYYYLLTDYVDVAICLPSPFTESAMKFLKELIYEVKRNKLRL